MATQKASIKLYFRDSRGRPEWWFAAESENDHPTSTNVHADPYALFQSEDGQKFLADLAFRAQRSVEPTHVQPQPVVRGGRNLLIGFAVTMLLAMLVWFSGSALTTLGQYVLARGWLPTSESVGPLFVGVQTVFVGFFAIALAITLVGLFHSVGLATQRGVHWFARTRNARH